MANICGASTKNGGECKKPPVNGSKRCRLHGAGGGRPPTHGRYSGILHNRLGELIERHGEDPDILDIKPEVVLLRALTEDYINRYEEYTEALLAWHEDNVSEDKDGNKKNVKPPRILDLADSYRLISEISKIVKRIEDIKANNAIGQKDFFRLVEQMSISVRDHVSDEEVREKIAKDWRELRY